jgi:hypothetical protein
MRIRGAGRARGFGGGSWAVLYLDGASEWGESFRDLDVNDIR